MDKHKLAVGMLIISTILNIIVGMFFNPGAFALAIFTGMLLYKIM